MIPVQEETKTVVLNTDADGATCRETRRSNSGGTLQLGDHLIAAWSRVQPRTALSSGEAELYAGLRGISETLGFVHMVSCAHTRLGSHHSSRGCKCVSCHHAQTWKHITVKSLWVQEAVRDYSITIEKVPRDAMHAHILASPSSADELTKHLTELNEFRSVERDDAGRDRSIEEEFGAEVPRDLQR